MILWILTSLVQLTWNSITFLIQALVQILLLLSLAFAVAYRMGWCHYWMWSFLEDLGSKACNGAKVTIGSFSVDFLRGILVVNNVVVHSPKRHLYKWESPVLVRMGHVRVEFNPMWCAFSIYILGETSPPLDVNLLHMSDIQCFLERKKQVFNVYLLDPFYVLPPLEGDEGDTDASDKNDNDNSSSIDLEEIESDLVFMENKEPDLQMSNSSLGGLDADDGGTASASSIPEHLAESDRAEAVVGEMLKAVHSLGRAVQEGQLPQALQEQRQRITQGLKEFNVNKQAMTQSLSLVQQVSKMVVERSQQAVSQSHLILQPKRQPPPDRPQPLLARFGRVILDDLRVFTRTTITVETPAGGSEKDAVLEDEKTDMESDEKLPLQLDEDEGEGVEVTDTSDPQSTTLPQHHAGSKLSSEATTNAAKPPPSSSSAATSRQNRPPTTKATTPPTTTQQKSYWNKPIKVDRVAVRASEFGAPLSAKDEQGFPVLFQPLDKSTDAIFKRVVGDMAKNNTGKIMRTAMGEVLDFYMEKEYSMEEKS